MARNVNRDKTSTNGAVQDKLMDLPPEHDVRFSYGVKKSPKKKYVIGGLLGLSLVSVAVFLLLSRSGAPIEDGAESTVVRASVIEVSAIEGGAEVSSDAGGSWSRAEVGNLLEIDNQIRVAPTDASRATLLFSDNSYVRLKSGSSIAITENTDGILRILLESGEVYVRLARFAETKIIVVSEDIEVEAVGTAFKVSTERSGTVDVYEGSVRELVSNTAVTQGSSYSSGGQPTDIVRSDLKKNAFIVWNREQDIDALFRDELGILDDIDAPDLNIISPVNNARIEIPAGSSSAAVEILGSTESGAVVKAQPASGGSVEVTADETGAFAITVTGGQGTTTYTITSTDRGGNTSTLPLVVEFFKESVEAESLDITLGAIAQPGTGIVVNWTYRVGFEAPEGVKVLWNKKGSLSYPVKPAPASGQEESSSSPGVELNQTPGCSVDPSSGSKDSGPGTSEDICLLDGNTYAFRVCRYNSSTDTCDTYSNEVRIKAPES